MIACDVEAGGVAHNLRSPERARILPPLPPSQTRPGTVVTAGGP
ncbi:hypothetical protein AB0H37_02725 [Actinomadura sp. NPDC023710]